MIILAIDPSLNRTGYAIRNTETGEVLDYGILEWPKKTKTYQKMDGINNDLIDICNENYVNAIFSEDGAFFAAKRSGWTNRILTSIAVIVYNLSDRLQHKDPVCFITPNSLKLLYTGSGNSDKTVVAQKVLEDTGINTEGDDDLSDALALSQCVVNLGPDGFRQYLTDRKNIRKKGKPKNGK